MTVRRRAILLLALLGLGGCGVVRAPDRFTAGRTRFEAMQGWRDDSMEEALKAFLASCPAMAARPQARTSGSGLAITADNWQHLCKEAERVPPRNGLAARMFFEERFVPFRIGNNGLEQGLFTGYYEPMLQGARTRGGPFQHPIYAAPEELAATQPYYSRREIDSGALEGRGLEIAWVDDPVMAFFLHIQGSGRIRLANGEELRVGYAGKNGHPYVAIGRLLTDRGYLAREDVNMFTIREWLAAHPSESTRLMQENPSYVFFRQLNSEGAVGAIGVAVSPMRTLAVDSRYIPYGLPVYLETELPPTPSSPQQSFKRLMIAQDTGGAIRGPVRGDIFFGAGRQAEYWAGLMKGKGRYTLLVPMAIADGVAP